MVQWEVVMEEKAEAEFTKLLKHKIITMADIKALLRWVSEMEEFGPEYVAESRDWHDHELDREWKGYRSSAFSHSGRVIYKIIDDQIIVRVARVTSNHNYKK